MRISLFSHTLIITFVVVFIAWFNLAVAFLVVFLWTMWHLAHA